MSLYEVSGPGADGGESELAYVEFTGSVSVTSTTEAAANEVVSAGAISLDGNTRIKVEFFAPRAETGVAGWVIVNLWDDSTALGRICIIYNNDAATGLGAMLYGARFLTPSAGNHTYKAKAWRVTTNGTIAGGSGVSGQNMPGFIRVTEVEAEGGSGGGAGESVVRDIERVAHGLAVGDWVRLDTDDYVPAQADTVAHAEVVGVVTAVADADNFSLTAGGYVAAGLSGLTAGAVYFLDPDNAGEITATPTSTGGEVVKPVLIADSTASGWLFNMRGSVNQSMTPESKTVEILVTDPTGNPLTTGDGKAWFFVPAALNGYNLVAVAAAVSTVASSAITTVQIANVTQAVDMLTTRITIDASEKTSYSAAAPAVIDAANDDVATGDELRVDVDVAGVDAKGLIVILTFEVP